jgi:hypothetical protein
VDLIEDGQGQDLADPRDGSKQLEAVGIVDLRPAHHRRLEVLNDHLVVIDQGQIRGEALPDTQVLEIPPRFPRGWSGR